MARHKGKSPLHLACLGKGKKGKKGKMNISEYLKQNIIGQSHVISEVLPYVNLFHAGLSSKNRPVGVLVLAGETGTGKTYFAQQLAQALHGSDSYLLRVDCAEYAQDHETARLITQAKLNSITSVTSSLSVVLFDEIEKASEKLRQLLLGIFDYGKLSLGDSTSVDFHNTLVLMTTNLGAKQIQESRLPFGFTQTQNDVKSLVQKAVNKFFSPEFLNRIDKTIVFNSLTQEDFDSIVALEIAKVFEQIENRNPQIKLTIDDEFVTKLQLKCKANSFGGREVKRFLVNELLVPLAEKVLESIAKRQPTIYHLTYENGLVIESKKRFKAGI